MKEGGGGGQTFYRSIMTASNVGAQTQAWQAKWAVFKSQCLSASVSFLSSPSPSCYFTCAIFCVVFDSRSSFFAPKSHGNDGCAGCYRRGLPLFDTVWACIQIIMVVKKWVRGRMGTHWHWSEKSKMRSGSHYSKPLTNCSITMFDVFHWLIRELLKRAMMTATATEKRQKV